jgi:hypothetical protein
MSREQAGPHRSEELCAVTARFLEANDRGDVPTEMARISDEHWTGGFGTDIDEVLPPDAELIKRYAVLDHETAVALRLARLLESIDASVAFGRNLPYGEGVTYAPAVDVVRQLGVVPRDPAAAEALRSLTGEIDTRASAEDMAWAFRKALEQAAMECPVAVVFDDIQWGAEGFFDPVEHLVLLAQSVPILVLCLSRPELIEARPTWPVTLRLEPLGEDDVDALIPNALAGAVRARIAYAAAGNPLFIHEMLAMAGGRRGRRRRRSTDHAGAPRCTPGSPRAGRAAHARVRRDRR